MRRPPLALAALLVSGALALAGCSGGDNLPASGASAEATASTTGSAPLADVDCSTLTVDSDSDSMPTIAGDVGAEPTVTWGDGAEEPSNVTTKVLTSGDGAEVAASDIVVGNYVGWQWGSDTTFDSSWMRGSIAAFALDQVITGWRCGLAGTHVGDRVELVIPADYGYGTDASTGAPTGTIVFVIDIVDAASADTFSSATADATMVGEQAVSDRGLTVSGDLGTGATVTVADGATQPTQTEFIVLAQGAGEAVGADSTVMLQMAFSAWDNSVSQSSWEMEQPQVLSMATATGLSGLVGVPVGSRVVALLPADASTGTPAYAYVIDVVKMY